MSWGRLTRTDGFAKLADVEIGLMRAKGRRAPIVEAMAQHIIESLDNLTTPAMDGEIRLRKQAGLGARW